MEERKKIICEETVINRLGKIIKSILDLDTVENHRPFVELGMKSLDIPFFIKKVSKEFQLEIPITSIFEHTTIEEYAAFLLKIQDGAPDEQSDTQISGQEPYIKDSAVVIGMSCRFPGGANDPDDYWNLLMDHRDGISLIPETRWDIDKYYSDDRKEAGKIYTKMGGFLNIPIDEFDAPFFNISPKEARSLDPQQRLLLELVWEAFDSAGLDISDYNGSNTGVYVGMAGEEYSLAHYKSGEVNKIDAYSLTGTTFSTACGRISYTFGFEGPCMSIDTACSSSLTALHIASKALQNNEIDLAVVAGVNLMISPAVHVCFSKIEAISADGHCKSFDMGADGYSRSEGGGVLILKRTTEAKTDRDTLLGIISGTAVNQDGNSNGLTAPNGASQEKVIEKALKDAGLNACDVGYVEMHGTGTKLGDPIEVNAVINSYGKDRSKERSLKIGSVKSNIGHLEAAAGMASVIKVLLSFKHSILPANLNFNEPNIFINWEKSSIEVVNENIGWSDKVKRAGINGFGFGGSNAHIILTEPNCEDDVSEEKQSKINSGYMIKLTAKTQAAMKLNGRNMLDVIRNKPELDIEDITYSNNSYKSDFNNRAVIVGENRKLLGKNIENHLNGHPSEWVWESTKEPITPKIAFLYTGQGSQYIDMGKELYIHFEVFKNALLECDQLFFPYINKSLVELIYSGQYEDSFIASTRYAQPLIFGIEYALDKLWASLNVHPDILVGHSIGEYAAAVRAEIMTLEDAVKLLAIRSGLMDSLPGGDMISIFAEFEIVEELITGFENLVSIAVINTKNNIVVSGEGKAIESIIVLAEERKIKVYKLHVSHAFHSKMMNPIIDEFKKSSSSISYRKEKIEFISTKYGRSVSEDEILDADYWTEHITGRVDFYGAVDCLKERGNVICIEIGASKILSLLGKLVLDEKTVFLTTIDKKTDNIIQLYSCIAQLYCKGVLVRWRNLYGNGYDKVKLPTYAFERKSYWMKPNHLIQESGIGAENTILGQRITTPLLNDTIIYQNTFTSTYPYFMKEHVIFGYAIAPAAAHLSMVFSKAMNFRGNRSLLFENIEFHKPLIINNDEKRTVQYVFSNVNSDCIEFKLLSSVESETIKGNWAEHCKGVLKEKEHENYEQKPINIEYLKTLYPKNKSNFTVYDVMGKFGFNLGNGFTRITDVWNNHSGGVCCIEPLEDLPIDEHYEIYPGTVDSILQSLLAVSELCVKMNSESENYNLKTTIPISIGKVVYHYRKAKVLWCHITTENLQKEGVLGDIQVYNENGEIVLEITNLLAKLTDRRSLLKELDQEGRSLFYQTKWIESKNPTSSMDMRDENVHYIILSENNKLGKAVYDQLIQYNYECDLISKKQLSDLNSKYDFKNLLLKRIDKGRGEVYKLVYISEESAVEIENMSTKSFSEIIKQSNSDVLYLIQAIHELQHAMQVQLWIVTENALGLSKEQVCLKQSLLWGFEEVIRLEYPKLWGGMIDYCATYEDGNIEKLIIEIQSPCKEQVCICEGSKRLVPKLLRYQMKDEKQTLKITPDATYIITGGTGGIGLTYAEYLIKNGAKYLLLLSRNAPADKAAKKIEQWASEHIVIRVKQLDISCEFTLGELIDESMPAIGGVIHSAGILKDKMIIDQDWSSFADVFASKVLGVINLHKALGGCQLDFFILMSSITSIVGNIGQSNYAAANYFLNMFSQYRQNQGLQGLTICWGPWAETGMAAKDRENLKRVANRGIYALPLDVCNYIIEKMFEIDEPCLMASDMNWNLFSEKMDHPEVTNFLSKLITSNSYLGKEESRNRDMVNISNKLRTMSREEKTEFLLAKLKIIASKIMGYSDDDPIQVDIPITEQGSDSLMIFSMRTEISKLLDSEIDISVFYNYPTIRSLNTYIITSILGEKGKEAEEKVVEAESTEDLLSELNSLI